MDKYKLVYIEWEDVISSDCWRNEDNAACWSEGEGWFIQQVGFIYKETKTYLTLVAGIHIEKEHQSQFHQFLKIPKVLIRKRIDLTKHIK